jgi:PadR family transcriptional regulator, regulatory protein PadR
MLEFCILNAIRHTSLYGFEIVRILRDIEGLVISEGTIYPILSRMKREGFVETTIEESSAGPPRKYYRLSERGETILDQMNAYWRTICKGADGLMKERST